MKKMFSLVLTLLMVLNLAACSSLQSGAPSSSAVSQAVSSASQAVSAPESRPTKDPSGADISVPDPISSMVVLAPSITEMVVAMGAGEKIVGCDTQSAQLQGVASSLPVFDMTTPDIEQLAALKPDVLFLTNMTFYDDAAAIEQLKKMGICVICIPTSETLEGIKSDIAFVSSVLGAKAEGEAILSDLQAELDRVAQIGKTITEKKKVYFEIAAAPSAYSFGSGVFLNEMLELIGAENILKDQQGWLSVEAEAVAAANPDVILTNVNYLDDPIGELLSREGWQGVSAIKEQQVYYVDNMSSTLPNQNIVKALREMAKAIYPQFYSE